MKEISKDLKDFIINNGIFLLGIQNTRYTYEQLKQRDFDPLWANIEIHIQSSQEPYKIYNELNEWIRQIFEHEFETSSDIKSNFYGIYGLFPTSNVGNFSCDIIRIKELI